MPVDDLAIVLTGTIIPNAPFTTHNDPQVRRREYLTAINFYRKFAPVYFLENSSYALEEDAEFTRLQNVNLRKRPVSRDPERGKGYQEFEMIDGWLASEPQPPSRWIKITGRYLYRNFDQVLKDCQQSNAGLLIDQCPRSEKARGYLFCVETRFYRQRITGLYLECNDSAGDWIEHVLYRRLREDGETQVRLFAKEPHLQAISGSTGGNLETPPNKFAIKKLLRRINLLFDRQRLWYTR